MSTQSFDPDSVLSDLLSWDCEAATMRSSQSFVSTLQDVDRYSSAPFEFDPISLPMLSATTGTLFTTDATRTKNTSERKLEINRISQKRVRERRKVKKGVDRSVSSAAKCLSKSLSQPEQMVKTCCRPVCRAQKRSLQELLLSCKN